MTAYAILEGLKHWDEDEVPEELLRAATDAREEITPDLVRSLEEVAENPDRFVEGDDGNLFYWALYLLASFEEPAALRAITRLFALPAEATDELLGDAIPADGPAILAQTAGDNISAIAELLENEDAAEDSRSAAAEAIGLLVNAGAVAPDEAVEIFRRTLKNLDREDTWVGAAIVNVAMEFDLRDLASDITNAYDREVVDRDVAEYDLAAEWLHDPDYEAAPALTMLTRPIDDIVEFFREKAEENDMLEGIDPEDFEEVDPKDPCPCGSGKNFENCCGKVGI
jgi:hypothetical protein